MLIDDLEPTPKPKGPKPLDTLSIDELNAYIADLKTEILRVEAAIQAKQSHAATAASFFKPP